MSEEFEQESAAGDTDRDTGSSAADEYSYDVSVLSEDERQALLAAILFSAGDVVEAQRLAEFFGIDEKELELLAEETGGTLRPAGLDILHRAGGYSIVTSAQWGKALSAFHTKVRKVRLSKSALEILAVIAYEQPVTRARVDELRQVNSESSIRSLLDRRLITVAGRADTPGRPFLYKTTDKFLEQFSLVSLDDLPPRPASLDYSNDGASGVFASDEESAADDSLGEE